VEEILGATETAEPDAALVHGVIFTEVLAADLAPTEHHFFFRPLALATLGI
jgi:hypothetical protein